MTDAEILGLFEKTEFPEFLGENNVEDFINNVLILVIITYLPS